MRYIPITSANITYKQYRKIFSVIFSKQIYNEKTIQTFEEEFAKYIGVKNAIAVSCGTLACYLCLKVSGAKKGDEVILSAYTASQVVYAVLSLRLKPVFVDADFKTYNLDTALIESKITHKTKFMLIEHLLGCPCEMKHILKLAKKYNIRVIEDVVQSCGAKYNGKKLGSFGDIAYFGFGVLKNFNTFGGGMVTTQDDILAKKVREEIARFRPVSRWYMLKCLLVNLVYSFLTHPVGFKFFIYPFKYLEARLNIRVTHSIIKFAVLKQKDNVPSSEELLRKFNFKFSVPQAIIGLEQLMSLDEGNRKRERNAALLSKLLKDVNQIKLPHILFHTKGIFLNYMICATARRELQNRLLLNGIDAIEGFLACASKMRSCAQFYTHCPVSEELVKKNLYLPIHPSLTAEDIAYIAEALKKYFAGKISPE